MKVLAKPLFLLTICFCAESIEAKLGGIKGVSSETLNETEGKDLPTLVVVPQEQRRLQNLKGLGANPDSSLIALGECEGT